MLLRTARLRAQKSVDECAAALSCDPAFIVRAEEGRGVLTLPQLEGLADILDVPLNCLLGEQEMPSEPPLPEPLYLQSRMNLRRKIIGVLLRQARLDGGYTWKRWPPSWMRARRSGPDRVGPGADRLGRPASPG